MNFTAIKTNIQNVGKGRHYIILILNSPLIVDSQHAHGTAPRTLTSASAAHVCFEKTPINITNMLSFQTTTLYNCILIQF